MIRGKGPLEMHSGPGIYDSFVAVILSRNLREIDITEFISVSIKVIIEGVFLIIMSWTIWFSV